MTNGFYNTETSHNIADKFWAFLNQTGPVVNADGTTGDAKLSDPWFYTTGYAISEPYWANVKIAGKQEDVLIQLFERRVLTYVPSYEPQWQVQMGNIGAHYYDWRYNEAGKRTIPVADITPVTVTPATSVLPKTRSRWPSSLRPTAPRSSPAASLSATC